VHSGNSMGIGHEVGVLGEVLWVVVDDSKHEICVVELGALVIVCLSILVLWNRRLAKARGEFHVLVLMLLISKLEHRSALVLDQEKISVKLDGVCLKVRRMKLAACLLSDPE
jgi:hypothetical protein